MTTFLALLGLIAAGYVSAYSWGRRDSAVVRAAPVDSMAVRAQLLSVLLVLTGLLCFAVGWSIR